MKKLVFTFGAALALFITSSTFAQGDKMGGGRSLVSSGGTSSGGFHMSESTGTKGGLTGGGSERDHFEMDGEGVRTFSEGGGHTEGRPYLGGSVSGGFADGNEGSRPRSGGAGNGFAGGGSERDH